MDPTFGAQNMLATMQATMTLFKSLINYIFMQFDELALFKSLQLNLMFQFTCEFPITCLQLFGK